MGRVSVPFCPFPLSGRVPVIGLVGHYPTNYLMGDRLIHRRAVKRFSLARLCGISPSFDGVFHTIGEIPIHYSAVRNSMYCYISFYLHALGMPPALILGQDQTLKKRSKPNKLECLNPVTKKKLIFCCNHTPKAYGSRSRIDFQSTRLCIAVHLLPVKARNRKKVLKLKLKKGLCLKFGTFKELNEVVTFKGFSACDEVNSLKKRLH